MFVRKLRVLRVGVDGERTAVPIAWLDSFAMRNFTNDAAFDDTLPVADGLLEAGVRVPLRALEQAMEAWLQRKGRLGTGERLELLEHAHPNQREPGETAGS